jgi:hypothetical protein
VNTTGHELYAFVNGKLVGEERTLFFAAFIFCAAVDLSTMCCLTGQNHSINGTFVFQLESPVKLHSGKTYVSLLSSTVGLEVLAGRLKIHLSTAK